MIPVQVSDEFGYLGVAAVSLRSTLKYRRNWNKNGPTVQLLRKFMPRGSKGFRVYMPIGVSQNMRNVVVPLQVRLAVKQAVSSTQLQQPLPVALPCTLISVTTRENNPVVG